MAQHNFSMPASFDVKIDNSSITHYRLSSSNPCQFFSFAVLESGQWTRSAPGHYVTAEPYWIAEPLQYVYFKGNRPPALFLYGVDYKRKNGPSHFVVVATGPYKKKTNFKSESELLSYVDITEVLSFSDWVPQEDQKHLPGLIRHLKCFKEVGMTSAEGYKEYMDKPISDKVKTMDEIQEEVKQYTFRSKNILSDTAMQTSLLVTWEPHIAAMRTHLLKDENASTYNTVFAERVKLVPKLPNTKAPAQKPQQPQETTAESEKGLPLDAEVLQKAATVTATVIEAADKASDADKAVDAAVEKASDAASDAAVEKAKAKKRKPRGGLSEEPEISKQLKPLHSKRKSKKPKYADAEGTESEGETGKAAKPKSDKSEKSTEQKSAQKDNMDTGTRRRPRPTGLKYDTQAKKNKRMLETLLHSLPQNDNPALKAAIEEFKTETNVANTSQVPWSDPNSSRCCEGCKKLQEQLIHADIKLQKLQVEYAEFQVSAQKEIAAAYRKAIKDLRNLPDSPMGKSTV